MPQVEIKETEFACFAVSGPTVDGREISRQQIIDMAETYNTKDFRARVWIDHFRSYIPDGIFSAVGDVLELTYKETTVLGREVLGLYGRLKALPSLVDMHEKSQKVFFSIEPVDNFAKSGRTYLAGLAVTDDPASLGTGIAKFCRENSSGGVVISDPLEAELKFKEPKEPSLMRKLFTKKVTGEETILSPHDFETLFKNIETDTAQFSQNMVEILKRLEDITASQNAFSTKQNEFAEKLNHLDQENAPQKEVDDALLGGNGIHKANS